MDVTATTAGASAAVKGVVPDQAAAPVATPAPVAPATQTQTQTQGSSGSARDGISPAVAKIFGSGAPAQSSSLKVSYKILHDPNQVVTVFSDPRTGQEVAQFPPELLVGLAEFFDYEAGVTLDHDA